MLTPLSTTESWAYDATLGMCIAVLWWIAEYASFVSQRRLYFAADFNRVWSVLTCAMILIALATLILEQVLRDRYGWSVPTSVATIVAASLSYVLVSERLRLFDHGAVIVQRILRSDKARFGRPGTKELNKYIIEWRRFTRGSAIDSGWHEVPTPARADEQILVDWSIDHRIGRLDDLEIAQAMRRGGTQLDAVVGILLYSWLPRQAAQVLKLPQSICERGALRRGYEGIRGVRIGCKADQIDFDQWITDEPLKAQIFQLIAIEYSDATLSFINTLSDIAKQADTAEELASLFIARWDKEIEERRRCGILD